GPASRAFMLFVCFYVAGAMWSDYAFKGVLYKGLFGLLAVSGVLLGNSVHTFRELKIGLRILLPTCLVWGIVIGSDILAHPGRGGRLQAYDINANAIASTSAFFAIICTYVVLYDDSKFFKML